MFVCAHWEQDSHNKHSELQLILKAPGLSAFEQIQNSDVANYIEFWLNFIGMEA